MDLNYSTNLIFPVPVHQFDVNGFDEIQDELIDYAYDLKKREPEGVLISNHGGWQSPDFSVNNEDDVLQSFLTNCLAEFPPIKKSVRLFVSAWVNINPPEAFNMKHNHPTSDLSGVLWIKSQKDCGNIIFESPRSFATHQEIECYNEDFKENNKRCTAYRIPNNSIF